ncbi:MAG: hypothetical protein AAGB48_07505 [Planctomycetota bacterium]
MRTGRTVRSLLTAGIPASLAIGQAVPPELAGFVEVDSPEAEVRIVGEDGPGQWLNDDSDPVAIEVTAPATATVRFNPLGSGFAPDDTVSVAGSPSATLLSNGSGIEGDAAVDVEYLPDGSEILVLHRDSQNIVRFDAQTFDILGEYPLDAFAIDMAITPDGSRAVLANYTEATASILDLTTGTAVTIPVGFGPGTVDITPDGALAAIANSVDSTLSVINLATNTVVRSIVTPQFAQTTSAQFEAFAVDFRITTPRTFYDNETLLIPGRFDDVLAVINLATGARTDVTLTNTDPFGVDVSGDGSTVLVGHSINPGVVTVVDPTTWTESRTIATAGTRSNGPVVLNQDGTRAVVGLQNTTRGLNLTTETLSPELNTSNLNDIRPNFDRTRAVGMGFSGAVIDIATGSLLSRANDRVSAAFGATSPTENQAAMLATTFGAEIVVIETDASPSLLSFQLSGPRPEGDVARHTALTPDGAIALSSNLFSDDLTIFDTQTGAQLGSAPLDERAFEVATTPDGTTAVAVNLDGFTVSIVDLATATTTALPSARRLSQVEISPDGNFAYVSQVASGDGVRKIDLNTNSFVGGLTPTGNMASIFYAFSQVSGVSLSPDGSRIAVAGGFDDTLTVVETAGMTVEFEDFFAADSFIARVNWSPEGDRLLVSDRDLDLVALYEDNGSGLAFVGNIAVSSQPFDAVVLPGSDRAFVINFSSTDPSIGVLDLSTRTQTNLLPLPNSATGLALNEDASQLSVVTGTASVTSGNGTFLKTSEGEIRVYDTATLALLDTITTGQPVADIDATADTEVLAIAAPQSDGIVVSSTPVCPADVNADGVLNSSDFFAWVTFFIADPRTPQQEAACDVNRSGVCDNSDFFAWVTIFTGEGCP